MHDEKKLKTLPTGHERPITRRQLIGHGLMTGASFIVVPSLFSSFGFASQALGGECEGSETSLMPFLVFDCVGGASLPGNWLVGKQGGPEDFLASYDTMGIPRSPQSGEPLDRDFGVPMFTSLSKVREGIVATASAAAQKNLRMATLCNASQDDSSGNSLSPLLLVSRAGLKGRHVSSGLGMKTSASGGRSQSPISDPALRPLTVNKVDDVVQALNYGPGLNQLSRAQRGSLARAISRLSDSQSEKLKGLWLGDQLKALAHCAYLKNLDYTETPSGVDPRENRECQEVYGLTATTDPKAARVPAVTYNVINGNSGPGVITIDGCDYHDGTQTTGDGKDRELGEAIGRAIELANRMGRPLFFCVITDGGIYSDRGTRTWRGDAGSKGLAVMGYFHPKKIPEMRKQQLGHFTDGQGVERTTYIGGDPKRVAYAILANYLQVNGKISDFKKLVPDSEFDYAQVDTHLVF
jgi:hypothetical protein